jgi:hypothetical protein
MPSHTAPFESQSGNCKKKQLVLAMHFDSLPDNNRTSLDVCFVTNLRLSHHTKLRLLHRLCVIPASAVTVVENQSASARANFSVLNYPQNPVPQREHPDPRLTRNIGNTRSPREFLNDASPVLAGGLQGCR